MRERYRLSSWYALLPRARRMQQQARPGRWDGLANSDSTPGLSVGSVRFARATRSSGLSGPTRGVGSPASRITRARKEKKPGTSGGSRNPEGEAGDETSSVGIRLWAVSKKGSAHEPPLSFGGGTGFYTGRAARHLRGHVSTPGRNRISASCLVFVKHTGTAKRLYNRSMAAATVAATRHGLKHESRS